MSPQLPGTLPSRDPAQNAAVLRLLCFSGAILLSFFPCTTFGVGATTNFTTYEAEAGTVSGGATVVALSGPPATEFSSPQLEASGHAYVHLAGTGQAVKWTNNTGKAITTLNIRYSIPYSSGGGGITSTINLYVNGSLRGAINVNSMQTWVYETSSSYNGMSQTPSAGMPHVFWDEVGFFVPGGAIPAGSNFSLQKDSSNSAAYYNIDCVDLETPPAALTQPANSLSITSYGAMANNSSFDNSTAINNCISAAQSQGKSVWIPQGVFYVTSGTVFHPNGITIGGAGPWYSEILDTSNSWSNGFRFNSTGTSFKNLCLDFTKPNATPGIFAILAFGDNWTIDNVWARHSMLTWGTGNNITVQNSRVNNSWGDGMNLNNDNGTSCTTITVQNNFSRGNGDDAIAINNTDLNGSVTTNVTVANNTTVAPWWANGMGIYGGTNVTVKNNLILDSVKLHGMYVTIFGSGGNPMNGALIQDNTIIRGGSHGYGNQNWGLYVGSNNQVPAGRAFDHVVVDGNIIQKAMYGGIQVTTSTNTTLQNSLVDAPGLTGIAVPSSAVGNAKFDNNLVTNLASGQVAYTDAASSANFPIVYWNEGEFLTVNSITPGITNTVITSTSFSNGAAAFINSNAVGNQVTYLVPSLLAGSYNVKIGMKKHSSRGIWQLAIAKVGGGFVNLGSPVDEYSATDNYTFVDLGTWSPGTSTDKLFQFTITGKNASSSGYDASFDYIELTPL